MNLYEDIDLSSYGQSGTQRGSRSFYVLMDFNCSLRRYCCKLEATNLSEPNILVVENVKSYSPKVFGAVLCNEFSTGRFYSSSKFNLAKFFDCVSIMFLIFRKNIHQSLRRV